MAEQFVVPSFYEKKDDESNVYNCLICGEDVPFRLIRTEGQFNHQFARTHEEAVKKSAEHLERVEQRKKIATDVAAKNMAQTMLELPNEDVVVIQGVLEEDDIFFSPPFAHQDLTWVVCVENQTTISLIMIPPDNKIITAAVKITAKVSWNGSSQKIERGGIFYPPDHECLLAKDLPMATGDKFKIELNVKFDYCEAKEIEVVEEKKKSNRGRPTKFKNHDNFSTKMVLVWYHNHHRMPLSDNAMQQLIKILKHPNFVINDIPDTLYVLQRCEGFIIESIPVSTYKFKGTGEIIRYHDLNDILQYVLKTDVFTKDWVTKAEDVKDGRNHPSKSIGWAKYADFFKAYIESGVALLVLMTLWVDGFVGEMSRKKSYHCFSVSFANFSNELIAKHKAHFYVATLPPSLAKRKNEFISDVIIPFFQKLSKYELDLVNFRDQKLKPVGGLHAIKGDHMSKIDIAGIAGTRANYPSFYTTTAKKDFKDIDEPRRLRDPKKTHSIWDLPIFKDDFYKRFALCPLHALWLGIVNTLAGLMGIMQGADYRKEISEKMREFEPQPGYARITMSVYRKENEKETTSLPGDMWLTYSFQSIMLHRDLVNDGSQRKLWAKIMNGINIVYDTDWQPHQVVPDGELHKLIYKIRKAMVKLFEDAAFDFPNFETLYSIPDQIAFLGPLRFQSTDREEELNRVKRQILRTSNHVNPSNELTIALAHQRGAASVEVLDENGVKRPFAEVFGRVPLTTRKIEDYRLFGDKEVVSLARQDRARIDKLLEEEVFEEEEFSYKEANYVEGFYLNGKKVEPGDDVGLMIKFEDKNVFGKLAKVFFIDVTISPGESSRCYSFVAIHEIRELAQSTGVNEGKVMKSIEFYPMNWGEGKVVKKLKLAMRPDRSVNVWVK